MARRLAWLPFLITALILGAGVGAQPPSRIGANKKLLEWGWDEPDTEFMRANARSMDRVGFDGVVFHASPRKNGQILNFDWHSWGPTRFAYEDFAGDLENLRTTHFRRLTENFLRFNVSPGNVDWMDDGAFAVVLQNARVAARLAREGGCKGLMFDVEMYHFHLFSYAETADKRVPLPEYERVVRLRGSEFVEALHSEFPDITVLLTFGYAIVGKESERAFAPYGLLKSFLDGMFAGARPSMTIVDANEVAYSYRHYANFLAARKRTRDELARVSGVPHEYKERVTVGFGVWLDMNTRRYGWSAQDWERNYFTPDEFAYSLFAALSTADRYVWVYTELPRWWTNERLSEAYRAAIHRAKGPFALDDARFPPRKIKGDQRRAMLQPGYDDDATFGDLASAWTMVADLPRIWRFQVDPKQVGFGHAWYGRLFRDADWPEVEIGRFWDEFREPYEGDAWYRVSWNVPSFQTRPGNRVGLWFGAADEVAHVWINGISVGAHDEGPDGWNRRFFIDGTDTLIPGKTNTVAVRVRNRALAGGIWKGIKLAVSRDKSSPASSRVDR